MRSAVRMRCGRSGPDLGVPLEAGQYLFATIHRAENREPEAVKAWAAILSDAATPERPVILALHPGTRVALDDAGIRLAPDVRAVAPQGYRTTLTLQLHAAAVLTDSGGVQREAAWLDTPCLILRDRTEWVEAVEQSNGRMVVVGLDRQRAAVELARLATPGLSGDLPPNAYEPWTSSRREPPRRSAPPSGWALPDAPTSRRWPHVVLGRCHVSRVVMFVYNDVRNDARVLRRRQASRTTGMRSRSSVARST